MMKFGGKRMLQRYIEHEDLHCDAELLLLTPAFFDMVPEYLSKWCFSSVAQKRYNEILSAMSDKKEEE